MVVIVNRKMKNLARDTPAKNKTNRLLENIPRHEKDKKMFQVFDA